MEPSFWEARWEAGQIGFHQDAVNEVLLEHQDLFLSGGPHRVLVPLCGKTRDLAWLAEKGHDVVGVELSEIAVRQLFEEADVEPTWDDVPGGRRARAGHLTVLQGDFFAFPTDVVGPIDRVWDRAALVALHPSQREAYADRIQTFLHDRGALLLDTLQYDPTVMDGPPWHVSDEVVASLYGIPKIGERDLMVERWKNRGHHWVHGSTYLGVPHRAGPDPRRS